LEIFNHFWLKFDPETAEVASSRIDVPFRAGRRGFVFGNFGNVITVDTASPF
jgi:hypothetical protein